MATRDGASFGEKILEWLTLQHDTGCSDSAFVALGPEADRPKHTMWPALRKREFSTPFEIDRLLPRSGDAAAADRTASDPAVNKAPVTARHVFVIGAAVRQVRVFLSHVLPLAPLAPSPVLLLALGGDAKGDVAPGMPHGGKVFSVFAKPINVVHSHQSPSLAIPLMLYCGNDSPARIRAGFDDWQLSPLLEDLIKHGIALSAEHTVPIQLLWLGDFPAAYSVTGLPRPARQLPRTLTSASTWEQPLCWLCGAGGSIVYNPFRRAPVGPHLGARSPVIGLPMSRIFYAPVHAITQFGLALLCDIARAHWRLRPVPPHPFAAAVWVLFPRTQWDPFCLSEAARAPDRRTRKPLLHVDPAVAFTFFYHSAQNRRLLTLLKIDPIPDWTQSIPSEALAATPKSAFELWLAFLVWLECVSIGDADGTAQLGPSILDAWMCMNVRIQRLPVDAVPPAHRTIAPAFDCRFVAFGPAAHAAVCSVPRLQQAVRGFGCGGASFLRKASEIWLEHCQGATAGTYCKFGIAASSRRKISVLLLERLVERCIVNMMRMSTGEADERGGVNEIGAGPAPRRRRLEGRGGARMDHAVPQPVNRAYQDVPLSRTIDRTLFDDVFIDESLAFLRVIVGRWPVSSS